MAATAAASLRSVLTGRSGERVAAAGRARRAAMEGVFTSNNVQTASISENVARGPDDRHVHCENRQIYWRPDNRLHLHVLPTKANSYRI